MCLQFAVLVDEGQILHKRHIRDYEKASAQKLKCSMKDVATNLDVLLQESERNVKKVAEVKYFVARDPRRISGI